MIGSVGNDFYGELYSELLDKEGILPIFEKYEGTNTGICCVICNDRDRGHITDLGASTMISYDFAMSYINLLKEVELIYTELFILKHRKEIVFLLAKLAHKERKIFGFNLPSFYFIETYFNEIKELFEYADIVFANEAEAIFFGSLFDIYVKFK